MINKADWLGCLLLTSLMVIVTANTNSTSANETSNGASIDNPSILIKVLNASTDGKAILPKLGIKRGADEGTSEEPLPESSTEANVSDTTETTTNKENESTTVADNKEEEQQKDDDDEEPESEGQTARDSDKNNSTAIDDQSSTESTESTETTEMSGSPVMTMNTEPNTESSPEGTEGEDGNTTTTTTKKPGPKEGSAVSFKPTLLYFVLLPLCITAKEKLLW